MYSVGIDSFSELEDLLVSNRHWANGKNFPVDHFHATGAESRFAKENLYGIYLTDAPHAWMAFWMAVTDRTKLRKRTLEYLRAESPAGRLRISSTAPVALCETACLYLVDPARHQYDVLDLRNGNTHEALIARGFSLSTIIRHEKLQENYLLPSCEPTVAFIDNWQVALLNVKRIVPDIEVILGPELIRAAAERVEYTADEIGEDYLQE